VASFDWSIQALLETASGSALVKCTFHSISSRLRPCLRLSKYIPQLISSHLTSCLFTPSTFRSSKTNTQTNSQQNATIPRRRRTRPKCTKSSPSCTSCPPRPNPAAAAATNVYCPSRSGPGSRSSPVSGAGAVRSDGQYRRVSHHPPLHHVAKLPPLL